MSHLARRRLAPRQLETDGSPFPRDGDKSDDGGAPSGKFALFSRTMRAAGRASRAGWRGLSRAD